jgi:hypothetical protein
MSSSSSAGGATITAIEMASRVQLAGLCIFVLHEVKGHDEFPASHQQLRKLDA